MPAIRTLTAADAALWFAALGAAAPPPADLERLAKALAGGPLEPDLRLVAEAEDGPIARFAARREAKGLRFWLPGFREGLSETARAQAMALFLDALLAARRTAGYAALPLETEPGDDQPGIAPWLGALRRAGFAEASVYRLHVLPRAGFEAARHGIPGLSLHPIEPGNLLHAGRVFRQAYSDTLDRRQRGVEGADAYIESLRRIGEGYEPGLWLLAEFAGTPAALALVNRAQEPPLPGMSAWVLEIGCLPDYRGRGFARALLAEILARLARTGCERLMSTIDDVNVPSIRLHERLGFARQPERFYLYRRSN